MARFRALPTPSASRLLGVEPVAFDAEAGRAVLAFAAKPEFLNPMGTLQGGFMAAMLDEAMTVAALVKTGMTVMLPTLEMKISFLAPGKTGRLIATGQVVRLGKRVAFLEGRLEDEAGTLLALSSATTSVVARDKLGGTHAKP